MKHRSWKELCRIECFIRAVSPLEVKLGNIILDKCEYFRELAKGCANMGIEERLKFYRDNINNSRERIFVVPSHKTSTTIS